MTRSEAWASRSAHALRKSAMWTICPSASKNSSSVHASGAGAVPGRIRLWMAKSESSVPRVGSLARVARSAVAPCCPARKSDTSSTPARCRRPARSAPSSSPARARKEAEATGMEPTPAARSIPKTSAVSRVPRSSTSPVPGITTSRYRRGPSGPTAPGSRTSSARKPWKVSAAAPLAPALALQRRDGHRLALEEQIQDVRVARVPDGPQQRAWPGTSSSCRCGRRSRRGCRS